jgi:hypothetical protein
MAFFMTTARITHSERAKMKDYPSLILPLFGLPQFRLTPVNPTLPEEEVALKPTFRQTEG